MDINKVELKGKVGSVRLYEHQGMKVVNFSLATERVYKNERGTICETTWHNVVEWASGDVNVDDILKGSTVHLTGYIRTSRYTSIDGTERVFTEIRAEKVNVLK